MPDWGSPVATGVQVPNFTSTLSGMIGLKQQQQALQSGALAIQGQQAQLPAIQAEAQNKTTAAQQTQAFGKQVQSGVDDQGNSLMGANGEMDPAKVIAMQGRIAPMAPEIAQNLLKTYTAKVGLQSASTSLDAQQKAALMAPLQAIATAPADPALVQHAGATIDQWAQAHPEMAANAGYAKTLLAHVQQAQSQAQTAATSEPDPAKRAALFQPVAHLANAMSSLLQPGQAVQTQPAPATVNNGASTLVGTTAPPVAGGSFSPTSAVTQLPAPGIQTVAGADGNPYAFNQQNPSAAIKVGGGAPGVNFPAGENGATQAELQLQRTAAQQAASSAPAMHNLNRSVIAEVDNGITTGKAGELIQKLKSATGFIGDTGTDYNTLGKLLERSAITAAQGMGPHTNAGLEAQVRANGSTDYSPGAIRKIAALNDAMTTGSTLYQSGLENVVSGQGGSVFAKRQFDQQWAGAMNPSGGVDGVQALRFKNAVDAGDNTEKTAILKEVGGAGSKGATALLGKLRALQQLSGQQ